MPALRKYSLVSGNALKTRLKLKKYLKFIIYSLGILAILFICIYKFYEYKYYQNLNWKDFNFFMSDIKKSKELPLNFYKAYEKRNPNSIKNDILGSIFYETECQSQRTARKIYMIVKKQNNNRFQNLTFEYFLTREIEKNTNQKQCLNWNVQNADLLYGNKGIENASTFYYKTELENLDTKDLENLILMLESPLKYNPLRK